MSSIEIRKIGITDLDTDCIVNAANSGLAMGSGVCGAIFRAAGPRDLQAACDKIGHCPTGDAVTTPGFALKAKYVIHAVGPIWHDGNHHEPQDLYSCYRESLERAKEKDCHSIGFPLISSGIFGYPKDKAWRKALQSCSDWLKKNPDYDMAIVFAVLDDRILELGQRTMKELGITSGEDDSKFVFFWKLNHKNEEFSNWYPKEFVIEGITYKCVEQYMMAKKAILFGDIEIYQKIMASADPGECKDLGKLVSNFDPATWDSCKREIVFNANYAKFTQNPELMDKLKKTGDAILAEASPQDKIWGIGMTADDPDAKNPDHWNGQNILGDILMEIRGSVKDTISVVLEPLDVLLSVCKVEDYSQINLSQQFCFTGVTDEEISLVCPTDIVPGNTTDRDDGWRAFRIVGTLDFGLIGILARISTILASNEIGLFAISTYNTDYILIKEDNYEKALNVLKNSGYIVKY